MLVVLVGGVFGTLLGPEITGLLVVVVPGFVPGVMMGGGFGCFWCSCACRARPCCGVGGGVSGLLVENCIVDASILETVSGVCRTVMGVLVVLSCSFVGWGGGAGSLVVCGGFVS